MGKKSIANVARRKRTCAMRNERKYTLNEQQKNTQQGKKITMKKRELIQCELCNDFRPRTNTSRQEDLQTSKWETGRRIPDTE